ncbi:hypothetical protein Q31b_43520 [Novipirellula aureliae]|uniref:Uncharacterized protein n=1 Tax=Novipirellula aureliae TaxID=2527966 RepID=A0A5C6DN27_9BACT|nr:hypothetical protein [Novipirellula aureliae]TWU37564.1 hypothetical protein Q31b_43520 [Novipirellula aureliae]
MNKYRGLSGRPRSGMTILETMAVMSMFLMFAMMATGILRAVTQLGTRTGEASQVRRNVVRLADRIRADARIADKIVAEAGTFPMQIHSGDDRMDYEWDPLATALRRSKFRSGKRIEVDSYSLPPKESSGQSYEIKIDDQILSIGFPSEERTARWVIESPIGSARN